MDDSIESDATEIIGEVSDQSNSIVSINSAINNKQLAAASKAEIKRREIVADFVNSQLKEGVDYGVIEATSKSGASFKSKPTLLKPGQEKIFSLFGLTARLEKDTDTLDMLGNEHGLVAYVCYVYKGTQLIGEGRGAAKVGDKGRDANSTIKIAEKRARMDACLTLGFSEYFTQDMDDPDYRNAGNSNSRPSTNRNDYPATAKQWNLVKMLLEKAGVLDQSLQVKTIAKTLNIEVPAVKSLTGNQISDLIKQLQEGSFVRVQATAARQEVQDPTPEDVPEEIIEALDIYEDLSDEEIAEGVTDMMESMNLTGPNKIRVIKEATGNPYEPKTRSDWIKVSEFLSQMGVK